MDLGCLLDRRTAAHLLHALLLIWWSFCCGAEATRRGVGAALLRKPTKLGRLVAGIASGIPLPLTVKIRTGESDSKINVMRVCLCCNTVLGLAT